MTNRHGQGQGAPQPALSPADRLMGLVSLVPDDFFHITIEGAASVLRDEGNVLRLNLCSTAIRMLFEHVMGTLAPEEEVSVCAWYKPVEGQDKPIRAQRIQYWLQGGLADAYLNDNLGLAPEALRKRLLKAFNGLSKHVHGRADTLVRDKASQDREVEAIVDAVEDLLEAYHECRKALIKPMIDSLDEEAITSLLAETIQSIDELATHHSVDAIVPVRTEVARIEARAVHYRTTGVVEVTLQWGSNSDLRRGDGTLMPESFPFECRFEVPIEDPRDLSHAEIKWRVDTRSWYGDETEEDDRDGEAEGDPVDVNTLLTEPFDLGLVFKDQEEGLGRELF